MGAERKFARDVFAKHKYPIRLDMLTVGRGSASLAKNKRKAATEKSIKHTIFSIHTGPAFGRRANGCAQNVMHIFNRAITTRTHTHSGQWWWWQAARWTEVERTTTALMENCS